MIEVTLSPAELEEARAVGADRIAMAPGNPRFAYRRDRSGLDTHTIGAMGEYAAAKAIGIPWPKRVNTFRSLPDLDPIWEVRWSSNPHQCKVATDDPANYLVMLVAGKPPTFQVIAFINAGWAQKNVATQDPGNQGWAAHFVPVYKMTPVDPGFHSLHAWTRADGDWACLYCGTAFEAA